MAALLDDGTTRIQALDAADIYSVADFQFRGINFDCDLDPLGSPHSVISIISRAVWVIAAVILAMGAWFLLSGDSRPSEPEAGREQSASNSLLPPSPASATVDRQAFLHRITWTIVDDRGQPVAGAISNVGAAQFASDPEGRSWVSSETAQLAVVATAPLHTTVEATVTVDGNNVVTLQRVLPLTVRAIDATDRPVTDVEVHIAPGGVISPSREADKGPLVARTT